MIRAIPRSTQPQSEVMHDLSRKLLERNSEYMTATGLPSLLCPMWVLKTLDTFRAKHGPTPAFFDIPKLIGYHHGEKALELYNAVMQIKRAIRVLEAQK
jgi:hypothetical protein